MSDNPFAPLALAVLASGEIPTAHWQYCDETASRVFYLEASDGTQLKVFSSRIPYNIAQLGQLLNILLPLAASFGDPLLALNILAGGAP